jgi:hypothetical protein
VLRKEARHCGLKRSHRRGFCAGLHRTEIEYMVGRAFAVAVAHATEQPDEVKLFRWL